MILIGVMVTSQTKHATQISFPIEGEGRDGGGGGVLDQALNPFGTHSGGNPHPNRPERPEAGNPLPDRGREFLAEFCG